MKGERRKKEWKADQRWSISSWALISIESIDVVKVSYSPPGVTWSSIPPRKHQQKIRHHSLASWLSPFCFFKWLFCLTSDTGCDIAAFSISHYSHFCSSLSYWDLQTSRRRYKNHSCSFFPTVWLQQKTQIILTFWKKREVPVNLVAPHQEYLFL